VFHQRRQLVRHAGLIKFQSRGSGVGIDLEFIDLQIPGGRRRGVGGLMRRKELLECTTVRLGQVRVGDLAAPHEARETAGLAEADSADLQSASEADGFPSLGHSLLLRTGGPE